MGNFIQYPNFYSKAGFLRYLHNLGIKISLSSLEEKQQLGIITPAKFVTKGKRIYPLYSKEYVEKIAECIAVKIDWNKVKKVKKIKPSKEDQQNGLFDR